jgi:methionyl-tRNA formyltransferase
MSTYVVASSKKWFFSSEKTTEYRSLEIKNVSTTEELRSYLAVNPRPRYIFFPHWSWKVNQDIYDNYECIVFHTAPLPYGRGGSPIQNLIIRGMKSAPVCALRMTESLDSGPLYISSDVSLNGRLSDIFSRISSAIEKMIIEICNNHPTPKPQIGEGVSFKRLQRADNELLHTHTISEIYDRIRMCDDPEYEKAFLNFGNVTLEFSDSGIQDEQITAKVRIKRIED